MSGGRSTGKEPVGRLPKAGQHDLSPTASQASVNASPIASSPGATSTTFEINRTPGSAGNSTTTTL